MFLPVLLVRDYGIMGWVVFAVPNVLGAAAMGWVLRDGMSERIVREHARAIEWFRFVTVVFQLWFLLAYLAPPLQGQGLIGAQTNRLPVVFALFSGLILGLWPRAGIAAWLTSIACAVFALTQADAPRIAADQMWTDHSLMWLAPVCAFGFALCPYLDPTFHFARQQSASFGARSAFTVGFGILFLAMIGFTLAYSDWLLSLLLSRGGPGGLAITAIAAHIGLQLAYTCTVHARCPVGIGPWAAPRVGFVMILAGLIAFFTDWLPRHAGLDPHEVVYRSFMAFYGLVFPAYVWLVMIPNGASSWQPQRVMRIFWATVGIAAPCYWMGFIERQELWLVPGLAIVLLSRLVVRPRREKAAAAATG